MTSATEGPQAPDTRKRRRRVLLVVTETSPLDKLWHALLEDLADAQAEVVALRRRLQKRPSTTWWGTSCALA